DDQDEEEYDDQDEKKKELLNVEIPYEDFCKYMNEAEIEQQISTVQLKGQKDPTKLEKEIKEQNKEKMTKEEKEKLKQKLKEKKALEKLKKKYGAVSSADSSIYRNPPTLEEARATKYMGGINAHNNQEGEDDEEGPVIVGVSEALPTAQGTSKKGDNAWNWV
ncbi:MAG: hypothetical protein EZS28_044950, partial [Streblomastix strix]